MNVPDLFINRFGRLRSGWRMAAFVLAFVLALMLLSFLLRGLLELTLPPLIFERVTQSSLIFLFNSSVLLVSALLAGWGCNRALEDLPWRALGWTLHAGWARDLALGSLIGGGSLFLATAIATAFGGFTFTLSEAAFWPAVARTLAVSFVVFVAGAAAEEALFRGYPLQTFMRSHPLWRALVPTSIGFALVHVGNPNVVPGFTFFNTLLAGVWLAVAYARTRSLWFPIGIHWAWNWALGSLVGLPVSGITSLAPHPVVRAIDTGPAWLTGGDYGIEGGVACTVALVVSTFFVWRTRMVSADQYLISMTDEENPNPPTPPIITRDAEGA